jgi:hypothetical protein
VRDTVASMWKEIKQPRGTRTEVPFTLAGDDLKKLRFCRSHSGFHSIYAAKCVAHIPLPVYNDIIVLA